MIQHLRQFAVVPGRLDLLGGGVRVGRGVRLSRWAGDVRVRHEGSLTFLAGGEDLAVASLLVGGVQPAVDQRLDPASAAGEASTNRPAQATAAS